MPVSNPENESYSSAAQALMCTCLPATRCQPDRYFRVDVGDVNGLVEALHAIERAIVMEKDSIRQEAASGRVRKQISLRLSTQLHDISQAESDGSKAKRQLLYVGPEAHAPKRTRIAVLNSHPIQYFAPLYAYLNAAPDLEVTALYLSDVSIRGGKDVEFGREVKWDWICLRVIDRYFSVMRRDTREPGGFWSLVAPQVWGELRSGRYDVLWLHGHNYAANLIALMAAKSGAADHDARRDAPRAAVPTVLKPLYAGP